jgi:DNA helicase-2/ATP-dependent DNA helicase PcrA
VNFQERLERLNQAQREAVETLEGPVMVIAGPGTGKTEILSARIANILERESGGIASSNILCLTFTDAGAVAMRQRLLEYIGPEAYRVNINTFHGFCNEVIQDNLDYFSKRELEPISDLEKYELIEEIINEFPVGHPLFSAKKTYGIKKLAKLYGVMKSEDWDSAKVITSCEEYLADLPHREEFQYQKANSKKGTKKGDPNPNKIKAVTAKIKKTIAAAKSFDRYQQKLRQKGRYDFEDMILWVLKAFKENEELLARYQEQFLYFLVDEYQDTNGSQNEILTQLISYWPEPNVFVVGDDDQSIYRFQGANMRNILTFYERYQSSVKVIVLTQNYRSHQAILDIASQSINNNNERLINKIPNLTKELIAANEAIAQKPFLLELVDYYNPLHEEAQITQEIHEAHQKGEDLSKIAVIYREHKQADGLIKALEQKQIPLKVRASTDVLSEPLIVQLLTILRYLARELEKSFSGESYLFSILHYPFFNLRPIEIALLQARRQKALKVKKINNSAQEQGDLFGTIAQDEDKIHSLVKMSQSIREIISSHELLAAVFPDRPEVVSRFAAVSSLIENWLSQADYLPVQALIELIFTESGILERVLQSNDSIWQLRVLNTWFNFIKNQNQKEPELSVADLIALFDRMADYKVKLSMEKLTFAESGVNLISTHSAKGLEFDRVYLLGVNEKFWQAKKNSHSFTIPDTLTLSNAGDENEESRRLFYVALTRAKTELVISYAREDLSGKASEKSSLVAEIETNSQLETQSAQVSDEQIIKHQALNLQTSILSKSEILDPDYLRSLVANYRLSVTHLDKYLRCPVAFYFESLLRVPQVANKYMGFGTAMHYALEHYFRLSKTRGQLESAELIQQKFQDSMEYNRAAFSAEEYQKMLAHGQDVLLKYLANYQDSFSLNIRLEQNFPQSLYESIPLTGKLDKIELLAGNQVRVIDYKTGQYRSAAAKLKRPDAKNPLGGDYWRQLVFYAVLIAGDKRYNWQVESGIIDFVEPDNGGKFHRFKLAITSEDITEVQRQIKDTYSQIQNLEFTNGCGESDCKWCQLLSEIRK